MTKTQIISALRSFNEITAEQADDLTNGDTTRINYTSLPNAACITLSKSENIFTGKYDIRFNFDFDNEILEVIHIQRAIKEIPPQGKTPNGVQYYDALDTTGNGEYDTYFEYTRNHDTGAVLVDYYDFAIINQFGMWGR